MKVPKKVPRFLKKKSCISQRCRSIEELWIGYRPARTFLLQDLAGGYRSLQEVSWSRIH